ncbi:MAG TPA: metallophosphoesterase family protein [Candidatus Lachnoclostridium pullistercoris]|uniref:Metallophosphoesterase family protein n=1 Tax=Candidatus Lachnoclostridium pullistercoris TaxID=2838632 RepID=A0A9D2PBV6_9FIRM|nr:metallophosphoesterase family protein [Candidatus Lachnoclostridium pullistercoris]
MKILAIADVESKALWDYYHPDRLKDVDVIISCGDLDPHYLSFLATFFSGPVLYVHGNHDGSYEKTPPEGCISIEDRIYEYGGVRFLGLGGSVRYKPGSHQYTQMEMNLRIIRLWFQLKIHRGFDVLVTHAPAYGLGDGADLPHEGFKGFRTLMEAYRPPFFVHGHVHLSYDPLAKRILRYHDTTIINAYEKYLFEVKTP